ncbi:peptidoglycan-binding domain-containing protein [Phytomonospora endophytica]|uniref:Peptidoglycan binding-like domain-containing protein n=1 Tax=Phytomonospora endophytica TaxID=714109 RepID=A0A841FD53_9ACTN|nr:peptidoglycan-binding domain-containing protein [Phytomonospora endophytica]MBB6035211.1 hypothetical protein [Phytomonospora endophytica]GIG64040.1 hypothetical protein Pen01_03350 [Phytomonospora endophytica]
MKLRKIAALALSILAFSVAIPVLATPASAAPVPRCNDFHNHFDATYKWSVPVYRDSLGATPKCLMGDAYNSYGTHVAVLQRTLRDCYGQNIAVDNDFGPATAGALANAQRFHHIDDDGVYGPETASVLAWNSTPNGRFFPQC